MRFQGYTNSASTQILIDWKEGDTVHEAYPGSLFLHTLSAESTDRIRSVRTLFTRSCSCCSQAQAHKSVNNGTRKHEHKHNSSFQFWWLVVPVTLHFSVCHAFKHLTSLLTLLRIVTLVTTCSSPIFFFPFRPLIISLHHQDPLPSFLYFQGQHPSFSVAIEHLTPDHSPS